ncbi:hypothetical protein ACQ3G6_18045 [Allorhizobium undicola]|uniref:hypothetical protein n=1 Tax=Allorhizobium undicola TaxID=78527 RepID=UPI003D34F53E
MDSKTADSIEARLNELRAKALKAFKMQIMKIYSSVEHPAFIPDSTVSEAVRAAEESVNQFVRQTVSGVSAISEAPEAFLLVRDAVAAHLLDLERRIEQGRGVPLPPDTLKVINGRFAAVSQRASQSLENYRSFFSGPKNPGGRPPTWDWDGATIHLIAVANTPDGLRLEGGRGDNAKIANMMRDWFILKTGNSPDFSDLKKRARKVIDAISKPQKAEN